MREYEENVLPLSNFSGNKLTFLYFMLEEVNQMSPGYISPYFVSVGSPRKDAMKQNDENKCLIPTPK